MQIQFRHLGHAEFCLKACSSVLLTHAKLPAGTKIPSSRILNAFSRGFGYSSHLELRRIASQPRPYDYSDFNEDAFHDAIEKGYRLAANELDLTLTKSLLGGPSMGISLAIDRSFDDGKNDADLRPDRVWTTMNYFEKLAGHDYRMSLSWAKENFEQVLFLDADHPGALAGMAKLALIHGDLKVARWMAEKAVCKAVDRLGTDSPEAFPWWAVFKTRSYMLARHTLGCALWALGERESAIHEMQELLVRDPRDHMRICKFLGDWCLEAGDASAAVSAYTRIVYDNCFGGAHETYNCALALIFLGKTAEAVLMLRLAFMINSNIARCLLERQALGFSSYRLDHGTDRTDTYVSSSLAMRWRSQPRPLMLLKATFEHPEVQAETARAEDYRERETIELEADDHAAWSAHIREWARFTDLDRRVGNNAKIALQVGEQIGYPV